ncbi:MAG: serine/threonine-protein kinase [Acidobacteria bacterium]|nr:serine/threonine-protein kinase [Acidobacteriota bacterium]
MQLPCTIAHYRLTSKLGEGGMGAVYRAIDTKLNREVAIKILPEEYARDADRMARFAREAQVLAGLNHPNIAAIYGLEERSLVLELVEGSDVSERIALGPIPLEEALPIARQLAEALEYAHDRGIVHRDLKPANLKITSDGKLKVLDFGLAKALAVESASGAPASIMNSPTMTMRATTAGIIMGTAGYMAPEQAKGKPVDRRADIWAFGVVFAEMLTGQIMYSGETVSETLASVIKDPITLERLPAETPPHIRRLLRRCLEKDPQRRLQAVGEARIALEEVQEEAPPLPAASPSSTPVRWKVGTIICALAAAVALAIAWRATRPVERPLQRFGAALGPEAVAAGQTTAIISPDGKRLVYQARDTAGTTMLATRLVDQSKSSLITGTEDAVNPFFSPDGQWIGFFAEQKLKKIAVLGGAAIILCDAGGGARGASWAEDGNIIANLDNSHFFRVSAAGGKPEPLAARPESRGERTRRWPQVLPGGEHVLYTAGRPDNAGNYEEADIDILNLKTGQVKVVQRGGYYGRYLPSGHIVYVRGGTLFALPFDINRMETRGAPVPVLDDLSSSPGQGAGQFDFSANGTLVFLSGKGGVAKARLAWLDSAGKQQPFLIAGGQAANPRLSPDGKRLALSLGPDISVFDIQRDTFTRLTFNRTASWNPLWMPDGKHIIFTQRALNADFGIWWIRSDGAGQPEKLFGSTHSAVATSISPDGRRLLFYGAGRSNDIDIWTLPLDLSDPEHPKPGKPEPFLEAPGFQADAAFSPDGRWVAYCDAQGEFMQVFVRPFPGGPSAGKWQVSSSAARFPHWSRDGRHLFFFGLGNGRINYAPVSMKGEVFSADKQMQWSPVPVVRQTNVITFDLAPDGKRVLALPAQETEAGEDKAPPVTVLLNFFDELKRRAPPIR